MQRASRSLPSIVIGSPYMFWPWATTCSAAGAVEGEPGDGQAALVAVLLLVVGEVQHRVDQVAELVVDVVGEHPQADADLRRGQAAPGASIIVSVRSLTRVRSSLSKVVTTSAAVRRTGSPNRRIGCGHAAIAAPRLGQHAAQLGVELDPDRLGLAGAPDAGCRLRAARQGRRPRGRGRAGSPLPVAGRAPGRAPRRRRVASRSATAAGCPDTRAIRVAGGKPEGRAVGELAGGGARRVPAHQRLHRGHPRSATTTTCPAGLPSAAAAIHRRSASSPARRSARVSSAQGSSSSTAPYPSSATGSAPGVATTSRAPGGTRRAPRRDRWSSAPARPAKARPSSSAVRRAPIDRRPELPPSHSGQRQSPAIRPHQRQAAPAWPLVTCSGPAQAGQRAGVRSRMQASDGA